MLATCWPLAAKLIVIAKALCPEMKLKCNKNLTASLKHSGSLTLLSNSLLVNLRTTVNTLMTGKWS